MGDLSHILGLLQSSLGPASGEPAPLAGGITNRNFRVVLGGVDYVVRLPGKDTELLGIDRETERLATEAAARLGIAPQVAAALDDCLVTRFVACRQISKRELAERVEEIALALRSFHGSGAALPASFRVSRLLDDYAAIVHERGGTVPRAYESAVAVAARIESALPAAPASPIAARLRFIPLCT